MHTAGYACARRPRSMYNLKIAISSYFTWCSNKFSLSLRKSSASSSFSLKYSPSRSRHAVPSADPTGRRDLFRSRRPTGWWSRPAPRWCRSRTPTRCPGQHSTHAGRSCRCSCSASLERKTVLMSRRLGKNLKQNSPGVDDTFLSDVFEPRLMLRPIEWAVES